MGRRQGDGDGMEGKGGDRQEGHRREGHGEGWRGGQRTHSPLPPRLRSGAAPGLYLFREASDKVAAAAVGHSHWDLLGSQEGPRGSL